MIPITLKNYLFKSKKSVFVFLLLAGVCLQAKAQWYMIGSWDLPIPNTAGWNDVFFLNNDTGFVVGSVATPNGVNIGEAIIIRTHNGGLTWDTTWFYSTNQVPHLINAIHCPNDTVCYAVGFKGRLYKTTDGGDTWTWMNTTMIGYNNNPPYVLEGVYFFDEDTGFVCNSSSFGQLIAQTNDGGSTWGVDTFCVGAKQFSFPSRKVGYTNFGCKTTDGGTTWNSTNTKPHENYPQFNSYMRVSFLNENFGFIASSGKDGYDYGYPSFNFGIISRTKDGGNTWDNTDIPTIPQIQTIQILSESTSYFGCPPNLSLRSIFKTENGGDNWYPQELVGKNILNYYPDIFSIHCPNDSVCYAVGRYQYIYKTTNGGGPLIGLGTKENKEEKGFTIYPNPANNLLTIKWSEELAFPVELRISDVSGRIVMQQQITNATHEL